MRARLGSWAAAVATALALLAGGEAGALAACTAGTICLNADQPICVGTTCRGCEMSGDCVMQQPLSPNCDTSTGACFNCLGIGAPTCSAATPKCDFGTCVQCTQDTDCAAPTPICTASNVCAAAPPDSGAPHMDGGPAGDDGGKPGDGGEPADAAKDAMEAGPDGGTVHDASIDSAEQAADDAGDAGGSPADAGAGPVDAGYGNAGLIEGAGCSCATAGERRGAGGVAALAILFACAACFSRRRLT